VTKDELLKLSKSEVAALTPVNMKDGDKPDRSGCSYCSDCSCCSGCSDCSYCSDCSCCSGCSYCSDCRGIIRGSRLQFVAYGIQLTESEWKEFSSKC
jgi:hypothetical protein